MALSTQQLREDFKNHLHQWGSKLQENHDQQVLLYEIQKWAEQIEKQVEEKVRLLESDFNQHALKDEYSRSVSQGFDNLEEIMRKGKTLLDLIQGNDLNTILEKIKGHYKEYFIPLFNIMSRLESDFTTIATKTIAEKGKLVSDIDDYLNKLKIEKQSIRRRIFDFNRKKKYLEISKKIRKLELKKRITRLTLHHDKLNLYYFTHNRPPELKEIKEMTDKLRLELMRLEGVDQYAG